MLPFAILFAVTAATNTNDCLARIPEVSTCIASQSAGTSCCNTIRDFANNLKCVCNPLIPQLVQLNPGLASLRVKCNLQLSVCAPNAKTYNGGNCAVPDVVLDQQRFNTALGFSEVILSLTKPSSCFNYNAFLGRLRGVVQNDIVGRAGYGLGVYEGLDAVAEYFSLLAPLVSRGFLSVTHLPNEKATYRLMDGGKP